MIRKIGLIGKTYRHTNRYLEIIAVFAKHGFAEVISRSKLENAIDFGKKIAFKKAIKESHSLSQWERIRLVMEELGPAFIKFGQLMSNRADLVPMELLLELEKLQDNVPPFSEAEAIQIVENELGKPINDIFKVFSSRPIAAASISQVHRATLFDGEEVVVKIQRPNLERIMETDLEIMLNLATMAEKHIPELKIISLVNLVEVFEKSIWKELNFSNEANNLTRFGSLCQSDSNVYVPKLYQEFSTKKILTMEFIDGIKISKIDSSNINGLNPEILAKRGADSILKQIFEYGFFHADPHPGNILVLPNNIICFLDFGMMGTISNTTMQLIKSILIGIVNRDTKQITKNIIRLCDNNGKPNANKMELEVTELVNNYYSLSLQQLDISILFNDLIDFFHNNSLVIPADLFLFGKALVIQQGNGEKLDPNFNFSKSIEPYVKKIIKERFHPLKLAKSMYFTAEEIGGLIQDLPYDAREIIEKIKSGKIKIDIEHKGLNPMLKTHDQISNRIAFAIVLASIIIGSSLIVLSKIPPIWNEIPVIGLVGFIAAGVLGFWLLISILRHGKM